MKGWRIVAVLILCLVLVGSIACNSLGAEEEVAGQLVEVVRADLTVTVTGSGNIEVSNEAELSFGVAGRVDKIFVEEGDTVTEGDILARLETDALELAVTQAQVVVTQAQVAVTQAQVTQTQTQVTWQTAEYNLEQAQELYTLSDFTVAQASIDEAERYLEDVLWTLSKYSPGSAGEEATQKIVVYAQARLNTAEDTLEAMLSGTDTEEVAIKRRQVEAAEQSLELARQSLELTEQSLELAGQSLEQALKQLDKATLTAPLSGLVASVPVDEQDTVTTSTQIIHLIDSSIMELQVQVDEIDIPVVEPGQRVIIEVDALPALLLEGEVSFISLLPTLAAGVTVYDVEIRFDVPDGINLRDGMSASADIVIVERNDVIVVPERAIKQDSEGNTVVEISMVGGENEERVVTIGISDGFQTEILDGLEEGEVIERRARSK